MVNSGRGWFAPALAIAHRLERTPGSADALAVRPDDRRRADGPHGFLWVRCPACHTRRRSTSECSIAIATRRCGSNPDDHRKPRGIWRAVVRQAASITVRQASRRPAGDNGIQDIFDWQPLVPARLFDHVQLRERPRECAPPFVASSNPSLAIDHGPAYQLSEANFGMHFAHHLEQFGARLEKRVNFPYLVQYIPNLLGDLFAVRRAGPRASTCVIPRSGCENRTDRRRKDAAASGLAEKFPCCSVAGTPSNFVGIEQANGDINRNNFEIYRAIEDSRQGRDFPNGQSVRFHDDDGPTTRGAIDASDDWSSRGYAVSRL